MHVSACHSGGLQSLRAVLVFTCLCSARCPCSILIVFVYVLCMYIESNLKLQSNSLYMCTYLANVADSDSACNQRLYVARDQNQKLQPGSQCPVTEVVKLFD